LTGEVWVLGELYDESDEKVYLGSMVVRIKKDEEIGIAETIKKEGSKWVVYAESGRKMGEYDTKQEALKRLRQIEYFKRKNEGLEKGFGLQGKRVKIIKGDHAGQTGTIQSETGYTEEYGVVVKIKLDSGEIVEYPADFWEEIKEKKGIEEQKFIARGIEKKEDAEKLAREKKGVVSQDPKDPKKFAVVVEEGKFKDMIIDIEDDARNLLSQGKSNEEVESILLDKYKPYLSANLAKEIIGKVSAEVLGKKVSEGKIQEADYLTLIKFFEENFTKIPEEGRKRITTLLVDSKLKEFRDLEIKLAEVKAEKDKLEEALIDYRGKLKVLILEKEKLNRDLKEAIKEREAKILELNQRLEEKKIEYDKKLQEAKQEFEKKLEESRKETIKKYINKKLVESGLAKLIPSGTQALLEKCSSEEEVDAVLEKVRDTLREATLHSGVGNELLVSQEGKPNPVYERIAQIMSVMFGIKEGK